MWGFRYCDLLLSLGKYKEAQERANYAIKITTTAPLLDVGLNNLIIGRTLLLQLCLDSYSTSQNISIFDITTYLNKAVNGLRVAGTIHRLPWGLFTRASLFRHKKEFLNSWTDLDEALEIAANGQMRLHLTDYHLEAARVILAQVEDGKNRDEFTIIEDGIEKNVSKKEMEKLFKEHVAKAGELIEETRYHRRDGELEELIKKM